MARSQPIRYRIQERQPITERLHQFKISFKALKQVQRIDCLTIENSNSILDLKFFDSLIEITGETWNQTLPTSTLINGKTQNSINSTVYCFTNKQVKNSANEKLAFKERIRIQNNDWIANLFPARNIQQLSKNIRLEIKLNSCDKLKLPKEGFIKLRLYEIPDIFSPIIMVFTEPLKVDK